MTAPEMYLPGETLTIERYCLPRMNFLKPSPKVKLIIRELVAKYSKIHLIKIHALTILPNGYKILCSRPYDQSDSPAFRRDLNRQSANEINRLLDRSGRVWDPDQKKQYECVHEDADDVFEAYVSILTSPVQSGCVKSSVDWTLPKNALWSGYVTPTREIGLEEHQRTRRNFQATHDAEPSNDLETESNGDEEEALSGLCFRLPRHFELENPGNFRGRLRQAIRVREAQILRQAGPDHRFLDRRIQNIPICELPETTQTPPAHSSTSPQAIDFAVTLTRTKEENQKFEDRSLAISARKRLFRKQYRKAWKRYQNGEHDEFFPKGTYKMQRLHGTPCHWLHPAIEPAYLQSLE